MSVTQSRASVGGRSTASSLRNDLGARPGGPTGARRPRSRTQKHVVTLDRVGHRRRNGYRSDEHDDEARAIPFEDDDHEFRPGRSRTRSIGCGSTRPSSRPFVGDSRRRAPKPVWTTTARRGRGRRDPDPRRARRGRRARRLVRPRLRVGRCRPARRSRPPGRRRSRSPHSVVAVSAHDERARGAAPACACAHRRDPHERPARRRRDARST